MRWMRNAAYLTGAIATSPLWVWRMHRAGKLKTDWAARFGRGESLPAARRPRVLIYSVSVGEVNAIRNLVDRLTSDPTAPEIVIAATTDTGFARAQQLFRDTHTVVRYPFDASWMVERFLDRIKPDLVLLCELEVWPNFVAICTRRAIPVAVINGRLSERSFRRYRLVRALIAPTFRQLAAVFAQNMEYATRFFDLGVPQGRVFITGNMKWDTAHVANSVPGSLDFMKAMGIDGTKPLVVAGSTAPEEHALLRQSLPAGAQLLCAPRKPEWFAAAANDLPGCTRRSTGEAGKGGSYFLLDTIGELRKAYAIADVVVIGRSFGQLHGSDPMEPAGLGRAVIVGPRMGDFRDATQVLARSNALVRTDAAGLPEAIRTLLQDRQERERLGAAAQAVVCSQQGATERTSEAVLSMLSRKKDHRA